MRSINSSGRSMLISARIQQIRGIDAAVLRPRAEMPPASRPLRFRRQYRGRTAIAANRGVALCVQRIDMNRVLGDVLLHLLVVEVDERIDADGVRLGIEREHRHAGPRPAVAATKARNERVVLIGDANQRLVLPHVAALPLPLGSRYSTPYFAVCSSIVSSGCERDDVQPVSLNRAGRVSSVSWNSTPVSTNSTGMSSCNS